MVCQLAVRSAGVQGHSAGQVQPGLTLSIGDPARDLEKPEPQALDRGFAQVTVGQGAPARGEQAGGHGEHGDPGDVGQGSKSLSYFPCKPRMTDVFTLSQGKSSGEEDDEGVQGCFPAVRSGSRFTPSLAGNVAQAQVQ